MENFSAFSLMHLITILIIITVNIVFFIYLRYKNDSDINRYFRNFISFLLLTFEFGLILWYIAAGEFSWSTTLPIHLCRLSALMSIYMLIKDNDKVFQIIFFFGMIGASLALITPDLDYKFPHFLFIKFFVNHSLIMTSILYMIIIEGYKIRFLSIFKSFIVLNIISVIVFFINKITGGNYFFLAHKPTSDTLLDYFGDGVSYYINLELAAIVLFLVSYFLGLLIWNLTNE